MDIKQIPSKQFKIFDMYFLNKYHGGEKMAKSRLWTKDFIIVFIANCFVSLTFYLLMTTMVAYAINEFQTSNSLAGLTSGIFVIGALFARLLTGKYIEVIGRKKLVFTSLLLFLTATLLYFPINHLNSLFLIRFIHGVAFGSATTVMTTAAMDMIPDSRRGEGVGYFALSTTIATAIGPFLGLFISQNTGYEMIFVACTIFAVLSLVIILFAKIPEATISNEQLNSMKKGFKLQDFFEKKALPISVILILMGIGYSSIVSFINSYAIEIQLEEVASFFFLIYAAVLFISRPIAGKLQDAKGDNFVMYPSLILFSLCLLLLGIAQSGFVLLLAGIFLALGYGTIMGSAQAIAIKESPKHKRGLATSTFFIFMDLGMGLGPYLVGMVIPYTNYRGMYLILAALVFFSVVLYYFLHGKQATSKKQITSLD